jgi:hypothetical protein
MGSVCTRAGILAILLATVLSSSFTTTQARAATGAAPTIDDLVLYAGFAPVVSGNWIAVDDESAAGGRRLWNPDRAAGKLSTPSATPADYFELSFTSQAGRAYRLWVRGQSEGNAWTNDSMFVQFSSAVDASGNPLFRIGSTSGSVVSIEEGGGKGLAGWGWSDNGYDALGPVVYFEGSGPQTIRIQRREDGVSIDQIVLSPVTYVTDAPGLTKLDNTILPVNTGTPPPALEISFGASTPSAIAGTWQIVDDTTAAGGKAVWTPNAGAAKVTTPLAAPSGFVEYTFHADAGRAYRLWMRGRAESDSWANDSLFVQFDKSLHLDGTSAARIGTTAAYCINLEDASSAGVAGWGWQDNGYGAGVLGTLIMFAESGVQTIRLQNREDGFRVDQIVLSSEKYLTTAPGALKNDATILSLGTTSAPQQPSESPAPVPPPPVEPPPASEPVSTTPRTVFVAAGADLQAAINGARSGDTLLLEPGATFVGNFVLPVKDGSAFITIRSATPDSQLPDAATRITPAHAPLLARIRSVNTMAAVKTAPGAHHWRLQLLEFGANVGGFGEILQIGDGSSAQFDLTHVPYDIELDRLYIHGDPVLGQKRGIALNGRAVTIRNSHIAGIRAVGMDTQAIGGWNGPGPVLIENNYLEAAGENFMLGGADPAIPNLVTEDVVIRRNYFTRPLSWRDPVVPAPTNLTAQPAAQAGALPGTTFIYRIVATMKVAGGVVVRSAASAPVSVDVMAGAAVTVTWASVANAAGYTVYAESPGASQYWTVSDTVFIHAAPTGQSGVAPTGAGHTWTVKNLFELKNARNVLVEENVFENHWAGAQPGYAFVFTPANQDGGCAWCVVENVTFQHNVARNIAAGFNILGYDNSRPSLQTNRIRIAGNLLSGVGGAGSVGGSGWFALIGNGPRDVVFDHNTVESLGTTVLYVYGGSRGKEVAGFRFTNNAARHGNYGINGAEGGFGNAVIATFFPDGVVTGNWLESGYPSRYPSGNYFDGTFDSAFINWSSGDFLQRLGGPLDTRATDASHIGANIPLLSGFMQTVISGSSK